FPIVEPTVAINPSQRYSLGRRAARNTTSASTPPGIGSPAPSSSAAKKSPSGPRATREFKRFLIGRVLRVSLIRRAALPHRAPRVLTREPFPAWIQHHPLQ